MSYFETSTSSVPSEAMKDYGNVSSNVRVHLAKVYGTLALACLTAAGGAYLHVNDMVIYGVSVAVKFTSKSDIIRTIGTNFILVWFT